MIYDSAGNLYVTPRTIGFHQQVQSSSNEVAEHLTLPPQSPSTPAWVKDETNEPPYCKRKR